MESNSSSNETTSKHGDTNLPHEAGRMLCSASIEWSNGTTYTCERDDTHDGESLMHGAIVAGEWTNWTDSYLAEHPEYAP